MKEELQGAIEEAFPPNHAFHIQLEKDLHEGLPPLMMQRAHLREIMVNLLVNAREAAGENRNGAGKLPPVAAICH